MQIEVLEENGQNLDNLVSPRLLTLALSASQSDQSDYYAISLSFIIGGGDSLTPFLILLHHISLCHATGAAHSSELPGRRQVIINKAAITTRLYVSVTDRRRVV